MDRHGQCPEFGDKGYNNDMSAEQVNLYQGRIMPNAYQNLALKHEADQNLIRERVYALGENATRLDNGVRGLADDCGELNSAVKKYLEYGQPLDRTNVIEEIGDCLWRLAQIAKAVSATIEECMIANLAKLNVRYGDGICTDAAAAEAARDRDAERAAIAGTAALTEREEERRDINRKYNMD